MKISINTSSYNDRRYGKPYIATIDFNASKQGEPTWGSWIGQPGSEGLLEVEATPGDIVMTGQKDFRNTRNSTPDYFIVQNDGSLRKATKVEAYTHATTAVAAPTVDIVTNPLAPFSDEQIKQEFIRRGLAL